MLWAMHLASMSDYAFGYAFGYALGSALGSALGFYVRLCTCYNFGYVLEAMHLGYVLGLPC